jgi:hypothetical protein
MSTSAERKQQVKTMSTVLAQHSLERGTIVHAASRFSDCLKTMEVAEQILAQASSLARLA